MAEATVNLKLVLKREKKIKGPSIRMSNCDVDTLNAGVRHQCREILALL